MISFFRKSRAPETNPESVPVVNPNRAEELAEKGYPELAKFLASPLGATALRAAWSQIDERRTSEAKQEQPHPRVAAIDHRAQRYYEVYPTGDDGADVYAVEFGADGDAAVHHTTGTRRMSGYGNAGTTEFDDPLERRAAEILDYSRYAGEEFGLYRNEHESHVLVRADTVQAIANIDSDQPRSEVRGGQNPDYVLKNLWAPPTR